MHMQVLHVAVLRRHHDTVQALIDFGYPLICKNSRKWMPIDEAVSLRDRAMVKLIHEADAQQIKALHKAKRGALLQTMKNMDDFTFKVGWGALCAACIACLFFVRLLQPMLCHASAHLFSQWHLTPYMDSPGLLFWTN